MRSAVPVDELHLVVARGSSCDVSLPNFRILLDREMYTTDFSQAFALPTTRVSTFYVETLNNVTGNGETINVPNMLVV